MTMKQTVLGVLALALTGCATQALPEAAEPSFHTLEARGVAATITSSFGGRVAGFGLVGKDDLIKFDAALAASQPAPALDTDLSAGAYYGHSFWAGPQSEWWVHQDLLPEMRGEMWPPDPYLTLQAMKADSGAGSLTLSGAASPYTGLAMTQRYDILPSGCLRVSAEAVNTRDEAVAWDIWFNTRVESDSWVAVPVAGEDSIRLGMVDLTVLEAPDIRVTDGIALADPSLEKGVAGRQGKAFMDPSEGWLAAIRDGQVFVIMFDLLPADAIHPEQGQVELYFTQKAEDPATSMIEMVTHAAYKTLAPGEAMQAEQYWAALPYEGAMEAGAVSDFVRDRMQGGNFCLTGD
ncbi:MAG: DUF4380 domain-containing protein [Hyphomonas sp.]|uniref:DUF4380 domain-containing protein n=1 Tax=Hyphomonas sp. TaxID=87 RepID=UPI0032998914